MWAPASLRDVPMRASTSLPESDVPPVASAERRASHGVRFTLPFYAYTRCARRASATLHVMCSRIASAFLHARLPRLYMQLLAVQTLWLPLSGEPHMGPHCFFFLLVHAMCPKIPASLHVMCPRMASNGLASLHAWFQHLYMRCCSRTAFSFDVLATEFRVATHKKLLPRLRPQTAPAMCPCMAPTSLHAM